MTDISGTVITIKKNGAIDFDGFLGQPNQIQIILPIESNFAMQWAFSWIGKVLISSMRSYFFRKS